MFKFWRSTHLICNFAENYIPNRRINFLKEGSVCVKFKRHPPAPSFHKLLVATEILFFFLHFEGKKGATISCKFLVLLKETVYFLLLFPISIFPVEERVFTPAKTGWRQSGGGRSLFSPLPAVGNYKFVQFSSHRLRFHCLKREG